MSELGIPGPATTLPSPAEAAAVREFGIPRPATALPTPAKAAAARELDAPGPATILPPPAEAAVTHAHRAVKILLRAEAAPFIKLALL